MGKLKYIFIVTIFILFFTGSCCHLYKEENIISKSNRVTLKEAIELGRSKLISIDHLIWSTELDIDADPNNTSWKKYLESNPALLSDGLILNLRINKQEYWVIFYKQVVKDGPAPPSPTDSKVTVSEEYAYERIAIPYSAYVFVEKKTGVVLGVLPFR